MKKKNKILIVLLQFISGAAFGIFGVILTIGLETAGIGKVKSLLILSLFVYIALFININIHEFGHFIFGKILGYSLLSYRIGFLAWNYENGKMKLSIIKNKGYSGLCGMLPPEKDLPKYKNLLFYAGGIIFNIVTSLAILLYTVSLPESLAITNIFLLTLGGMGMILGLSNFLPFVVSSNPSDGKIIWSLLLKKKFAEKLLELNKIVTKLSAGVRPRDLEIAPPENLEYAEAHDISALPFAYFKALDSKNHEDMLYYADLLEKNIENFSIAALPAIYYELCFIASITEDIDKAKAYYEKGGKILQKDKDTNGLRVKAYYEYYINKNINSSLELCENALAVSDKFPIKGQGLMEKDLVIQLKELINKGA